MVWPSRDRLKLIVSPLAATRTACLSVPAPLSLVFITEKVEASMREALPRKAAAGRITQEHKLRTRLQIEAAAASIDKVVFISGTKVVRLFPIK
jgi:hypothetical protein